MEKKVPLDKIRRELDRIDNDLLDLVKERMLLVAAIGTAKRATGKHSFDRSRERKVFSRAEEVGAELGLDKTVVREVMSSLIEASHTLQEGDSKEPDKPVSAGETRRLLIVGGRGKMGKLFARMFRRRGHNIDILDRGEPYEQMRIERADVILVAVPMMEAEAVAAELCPLVRPDAVLCDINSLKKRVCDVLAKHSHGQSIGTHPMFGPTVKSFRRQKIVVCPVQPGPMVEWLKRELGQMGAEIIETDAETHDQMMGIVQVLTHFGIMVMAGALRKTDLTLDQTLEFMSPIYRLEVSIVGRLFSQSPELYREILMCNPFSDQISSLFVEQAEELSAILSGQDRSAFVQYFKDTASYFSDFSMEAMMLTDEIIERIMSRP